MKKLIVLLGFILSYSMAGAIYERYYVTPTANGKWQSANMTIIGQGSIISANTSTGIVVKSGVTTTFNGMGINTNGVISANGGFYGDLISTLNRIGPAGGNFAPDYLINGHYVRSNITGNVMTIQQMQNGGYSAIRFIDDTATEHSAIGLGNSGSGTYVGNFWEALNLSNNALLEQQRILTTRGGQARVRVSYNPDGTIDFYYVEPVSMNYGSQLTLTNYGINVKGYIQSTEGLTTTASLTAASGTFSGEVTANSGVYSGAGVTVNAGNLYVGAGDIYSSTWTDISSTTTLVGWSSTTVKSIWHVRVGKLNFISFRVEGTSNSTATNFTLPSTPINSVTNGDFGTVMSYAVDNGSALSTASKILPYTDGKAYAYSDMASSGWTASGTKKISGNFWYREQ